MSYGLNIYNNSSFLQISENFKNYTLHVSGTVIVGTNTAVTFPALSAEVPLVFIRTTNTSNWIGCWVQHDRIILNAFTSTGNSTTSGVSVQYAVFTKQVPQSTNTYGVRVYNSSGQLCFDSGLKYPRVAYVTNVHPWYGSSTASSRTVTFPTTITTPWYQVMPHWLHIIPYDEDFSDVWYHVFRHGGSGFYEVASIRYNDGSMSRWPSWKGINRPTSVMMPSNLGYSGAILIGSY